MFPLQVDCRDIKTRQHACACRVPPLVRFNGRWLQLLQVDDSVKCANTGHLVSCRVRLIEHQANTPTTPAERSRTIFRSFLLQHSGAPNPLTAKYLES